MDERYSWHTAETHEALDRLHVDPEQGLTAHEAQQRLHEHGPNELIEHGLKSPWRILWEQLTAIMVVVLIIAAVVSLLVGDQLDAIAILAIVILNAILGFVQEYRAERAMAALKRMAAPVVKVRREGQLRRVPAREIVPGDILVLDAGDAVSGDARVLESVNLRIEEASLTGESIPVEKHSQALSEARLPVGDRRNMLHMGTTATYGRGSAVVVETGMNTQLGRIAELIQTVGSDPTPLQKRMAQLGKGLAVAAVAIVGVVFFLGLLRGEEVEKMFLTAIAMAVAAVPEGLPAVVTITLALGAQRMLRRRALIRKLPAVETLGSVTVICSDKTGTLTENRMTVEILDVAGHTLDFAEALKVGNSEERAWADPEKTAEALLLAGGALCNDAALEVYTDGAGGYRAQGDPTERALVVAAARYGLMKPRLESLFPRVAEAPFSSERKRMTTFHEPLQQAQDGAVEARLAALFADDRQPFVAFTKGATESLLRVCDRVWTHSGVQPLTPDWRRRIEGADDRLAGDGLRVLGVAFRTLPALSTEGEMEALERDLTFVGLVAMIDPPRPEVKEAVAISRTAGVRPVMITGDHPQTALHIARELDIALDRNVLAGQELERMTAEQLEARVEQVAVYARVSPEHKLNIIRALQKRGHIVAMTGDGVNDAPALKRADIGVAMGITGTDVSKEAADMIILDDNFATIVRAIEQGRVIYDNVRKFIKYTLTSNAGEIYVMLFGPLLGMPLPLTALQILWINLVTDGLPGLALAVEPAERDTMRRPPYPPKQSIFARGMGRYILWVGLLMGLVSLALGYWAWITGRPAWQTMVFTTLTLSQMGNVLAVRSGRESLFKIGLLTNKPLMGAVALTFALQLAVIFWRPLQEIFKTQALTAFELGISLGLSTIVFWAVEIEKWLRRRRG
ncbi:MAG: cation-translocating P-type ATPase [Anaerolineae bacterium]|nr:MAG: cation-translocating P-type ATPase [Anaerolineae bacterium]